MCGHGCVCSNSRVASCVLAILRRQYYWVYATDISTVFFLGAFQQSAGLITCKDYKVMERKNLGRERSRDIFVKTM